MAQGGIRLERTLGPLVIEWMERELVHGPGDVQGQPLHFDDEQVRFIMRAYEIDDAGKRVVTRAAYSRAKGRAKSELAGALVCAEALGPVRFAGWDARGMPLGRPVTAPFVPCMATEEGQATRTVYGVARFMLDEGPISRMKRQGLDVGLTRINTPGGGLVMPFSSKSSSKEGGKETFASFDETHLYTTPETRGVHHTIRRNLGKRKIAEPWSLDTSTMYAPGENSIAESTHKFAKLVEAGKVEGPGFLFDHHEGPVRFDFDDDEQLYAALVSAYGEAASWMDIARLVRYAREPDTNQSDFLRYYINRATKREATRYIRNWDDLADESATIDEGAMACLGADGSRTWDTTAVAWASAPVDGVITVDARIFSVRKDVAHHTLHNSGKIDFDDVEGFILDRFDYLQLFEAAYDPRYLERSADILDARLPAAALIPVEPWSKNMREALQLLEKLCGEKKIVHRGDEAISAHFGNCKVERGQADEIRRVQKIDAARPIDAVPAIALAVWRAFNCEFQSSVPLVAFG